MVGFILDKLVRDGIPLKFRAQGIKYRLKRLDDREFEQSIIKKLYEEAEEFLNSKDRTDKMTEAGDLLEVLDSACDFYGVDLRYHTPRSKQEIPQESTGRSEVAKEFYNLIKEFTTDPSRGARFLQSIYELAYPISKEEISEKRSAKGAVDGVFRKRVYITEVDVPDDSPWLPGFQEYPDKYLKCHFIGESDLIDCFE